MCCHGYSVVTGTCVSMDAYVLCHNVTEAHFYLPSNNAFVATGVSMEMHDEFIDSMIHSLIRNQ